MEEKDVAVTGQMLSDELEGQVVQDPPNKPGSNVKDLNHSAIDTLVIHPAVEPSGNWDSSAQEMPDDPTADWHTASRPRPRASRGNGNANRTGNENQIDVDLLDEGIRLLRWKDYSADAKPYPYELDEFQPGFDPEHDTLCLVVHFGGSWEDQEGEGGVVSTTEIYLDAI